MARKAVSTALRLRWIPFQLDKPPGKSGIYRITAGKKWLLQRGNPYRVNGYDFDNVTGIDWGVYGAPETFLIDAEGIIRYKYVGPITQAVWEQEFLPRIEIARGNTPGAES